MTEHERILWLTPDKPDDISVGRQRIADHLQAEGFSVTVRGTTPKTVLRSLQEQEEYDIVVGTTRAGAFAGLLVKILHRRPLVIDHVDPVSQFEKTHPRWLALIVKYLENASFRVADAVLYTYQEERPRVERRASETTRTNLGVEFDRFANPSERSIEAARERLRDIPLEEHMALYIGGLEPIYNIEALVEAFDHLEDWSLVIIGDGSLRESVEDASNRQGNVQYLGTVLHDEVPGFTALADVGISLVDDAHTLKVLEYGAAGLPTVQVEGAAEQRFGDQLEYCSLEPEAIADAILSSVDRDGTELQSFVKEYDWSAISGEYARVIRSVK